jgi:hypothetical protein
MKKNLLFVFLMVSIFCQAGKPLVTPPMTIYVNVNATGGTYDGQAWETAYQDLQVAMNAAEIGDEIWIAAGTYYPTQKPTGVSSEDDRDKTFYLNKDLKLYGGFVGTEGNLGDRDPIVNKVILSGDIDQNDDLDGGSNANNAYHVFITYGLTSDAYFDGLNITGGNANSSETIDFMSEEFNSSTGGGQLNSNSSPILTNCNIYNNFASAGGGQYNSFSSSPILMDCNIFNNTAEEGGGQYNDSSSPILTNCSIYNNTASNAGGGQQNNNNSNPSLSNCNLYNNGAFFGGGQYNIYSSSPTLANCNIYNNSAVYSGGGQTNFNSSSSILTNCNIYNNNAKLGGGQYNLDSSPVILNCNIYSNSATTTGGGQYNSLSDSDYSPIVKNSIFWENKQATSTTDPGADIYNKNGSPTVTYSITQVYGSADTDGIIKANPQFTDPVNGDFTLLPCSPAINTGDNGTLTVDDKDAAGNTRIVNTTVDMGAYEFQSVVPDFGASSPLATTEGTYTSAVATVDEDWTHYCSCDNQLLLSLKIGASGAVIPDNGVSVKIGDEPATYYATNTGFISNPEGAVLMTKQWNVSATTQPTSGQTVGVRFYYTDADYTAVNTALTGNGKTALTNQNQMSFYKVTASGPGVFPGIGNVQTNEVQLLRNGMSPSVSIWTLGAVTGGNYAEFLVSSFSGGGGGSGPAGGALPVTLASFTAKMQNQAAVLRWTTAAESHNQGFEIQRRVNTQAFERIGFVNAQGEGTSARNQDYTFTDTQMQAGANYYRLKQLDTDGTYTYSRIVSLDHQSGDETNLYPMPVADVLHVNYNSLENEDLQVTLLSQSGTVQYSKAFKVTKGTNTLRLDFASMKTGGYLIQFKSPKATVTRHLTKE